MRKSNFIKPAAFRFKRWSRKNYSIFCSLNRQVNIGVLNNRIADASCVKSSESNFSESDNRSSFKEGDDDENKKSQQTIRESIILQQSILPMQIVGFECERNYFTKKKDFAENGFVIEHPFSAFFMISDYETTKISIPKSS